MLAVCHKFNFAEWGCRVCAFNAGFCVTNLSGEVGSVMRIPYGARDSANAPVKVVMRERDADIEEPGTVDINGGVVDTVSLILNA